MDKNSWKDELARDIIALGSIPFYFIVFIRAVIGKYLPFIYHMLFAAILIFLLSKLIKNSDLYIARSFVLFVFTSFFYRQTLFTIFAGILFILMMLASFQIHKNKTASTTAPINGLLIGILSSILSRPLTVLMLQFFEA